MVGIKNQTIFASTFGNALEWYDFTAYAFFAPVIASLFFPAKDPITSLLMTFGVFAAGFLIRPLGGIFFGYLGDHFGRKRALITSMSVMSIPTFLLGLLPSYASIGVAAPLLLMLLRFVQCTAVSGEITSSTTFLIEHADSKKRGVAGSLAMRSAYIGVVLGSAVTTAVTAVTTYEQLHTWGWRLPFLIGGILGVIGLLLRLNISETKHYEKTKKIAAKTTRPSVIKHLLGLNYKVILLAILLTSVMAVSDYLLIGYFNTFLIQYQSLSMTAVMFINLISLSTLTLLLPLMGNLSDKFGRKPVLATGMSGFIVLTLPIFWLLTQHNIVYALLGELMHIVLVASIAALIPTTLAELFPTRTRNTGVAISYNTCQVIFGGTAPVIALALTAKLGNSYAPAFYLIACAIVSLLTLSRLKETHQQPLQ